MYLCFYFLAEFIIHLSEKNNTPDTFKKALIENGAEFSDSFMSNLLRIIQHMKPKKKSSEDLNVNEKDDLANKFPGLAIPNEPQKPLTNPEAVDGNNEIIEKDSDAVADLMAQFEAQAPSSKEKQKRSIKKEGSRSPPPKKKKSDAKSPSRRRSISRHRSSKRNRSRSRSRERKSRRDRESNDDRNRSRYRHRSRERSRSRSRDRKKDHFSKRPNRDRGSPELEEDPTAGKVYY